MSRLPESVQFGKEKETKSKRLSRAIEITLNGLSDDIEGKTLTLLEALINDKQQLEASKSTFRTLFHRSFFESYWQIISYLDGYSKAIGEQSPTESRGITASGYYDASSYFKDEQR